MAGTGAKISPSSSRFQRSDEALTAEKLAIRFGYMTIGEVRMLKYCARLMAKEKRVPTFVNVGAGAGTSALAMREAAPRANIYSVDISPGGPLGGFEGETNAFNSAMISKARHPTQILGDSGEVAGAWQNGEIDLLFIDDGHQLEEVSRDILSWWPYLRLDGIISFHDYGAKVWPGVAQAVDELVVNAYQLFQVDTFIAFRKKG